ncbi:hypothetical protein [Pricia sp.]|uniref:OB-fold protein n=1 Tax=Pricia sp. TaxID=2268138 RepID=UPI00359429A4
MKKIQKKHIALSLLIVLVGTLFLWYIDRPDRHNYINDRPLIAITIDNISDYFKPNTKINTLEPEQLVEIEGRIKEINTLNGRHTILLKGTLDQSPYIICDMQKGQEKELELLIENDTIRVKGVFKGFLKDAVFLHCIVTHQNLHE